MSAAKKPVGKITVSIVPGPASPAQMAAWRRFWTKKIAEVHDELGQSQTGETQKGSSCDKTNQSSR